MTQFEKTAQLLKNQFILVSYIVLVVLIYKFADAKIANFFHDLDLRTKLPVLKLVTALGKDLIYLILFLLLALFFRYIKKEPLFEARSWYLFACIVLTSTVCLFIKVLLGRARPELLFSANLFGFYWLKFSSDYWSLPSGHTTTVMTVVAGLGVLFPRCFYLLLAIGLLIVLTRVVLYYHYLSDVMTAIYLNILLVALLTAYLKKNNFLRILWKTK